MRARPRLREMSPPYCVLARVPAEQAHPLRPAMITVRNVRLEADAHPLRKTLAPRVHESARTQASRCPDNSRYDEVK